MNHTPHLFISVGATGAFFTLRETCLVWNGFEYVPSSYHIRNLSQDADEAMAKASEYAERVALELRANVNTMQAEMREITRATAEQLAVRAANMARAEADFAEQRRAYEEERLAEIARGVFPNGPYRGSPFADAPRGYITWLVNNAAEFDTVLMQELAKAVAATCGHLVFPTPDKALHVGTIGKRETFNVVVTRVFRFEGYYGWTYITTMVCKATNACIVSKGAFAPEEGEELVIKATVKAHDEYKGQAQTVVQRVAIQ